MIRKDYRTGNFPVCKTVPVLCLTKDHQLLVAYSSPELKQILETYVIVTCLGVWPGKWNTDVFILDPENYKNPIS